MVFASLVIAFDDFHRHIIILSAVALPLSRKFLFFSHLGCRSMSIGARANAADPPGRRFPTACQAEMRVKVQIEGMIEE
jgi:hypothetical protein